MTTKFAALAFLLSLSGYSFSGRPVIGTISYYGEPVQITLPSSVARGQLFSVKVAPYGGGCLNQGYVNIVPGTSGATITPYDIDTSVPDVLCTLELVQHSHTIHLSFDKPGQVYVRIAGLKKVLNENDARITEARIVSVR